MGYLRGTQGCQDAGVTMPEHKDVKILGVLMGEHKNVKMLGVPMGNTMMSICWGCLWGTQGCQDAGGTYGLPVLNLV